MPIDEEQPDFALEITEATQRTVQSRLMTSGVAGVLSLMPIVGSAVTEMLTELAIQRTNERMKKMFEYFADKIRDVGEEKVDREWFRSEEFQTLLYDAIQQLHVTHDREKIEMLGVALANSGAPGFRDEERKDLFVRFVRELTPQHLKVLLELVPPPSPLMKSLSTPPPGMPPLSHDTIRKLNWDRRPTANLHEDDLLAIQMLHAYGLVEESLRSQFRQPHVPAGASESQMRSAFNNLSKEIEKPPIRLFRLSPLGQKFLDFMGLPKMKDDGDQT
jgi:hypothetical protein